MVLLWNLSADTLQLGHPVVCNQDAFVLSLKSDLLIDIKGRPKLVRFHLIAVYNGDT